MKVHGKPLRHTTQTFFVVNYWNLDAMIQRAYRRPDFAFVDFEPAANHSSHTFCGIDGTVDKADEQGLRDFAAGEGPDFSGAGPILQDMCRDGMIPPGDYLVNVDWD